MDRDIYRDIVSILNCVRFVAFLNLAGTESEPTLPDNLYTGDTCAHTLTHTRTHT